MQPINNNLLSNDDFFHQQYKNDKHNENTDINLLHCSVVLALNVKYKS